ncbi:MAG: hypothetical protein K2Q21_02635 [Chitinophagaceae bacterium]|nr:hypothetical protein [Chitinophagaceae bacterium]
MSQLLTYFFNTLINLTKRNNDTDTNKSNVSKVSPELYLIMSLIKYNKKPQNISIALIEKIFSDFVFGESIPEIIKYNMAIIGGIAIARSEGGVMPDNESKSNKPTGIASLSPGIKTVRKKRTTKYLCNR